MRGLLIKDYRTLLQRKRYFCMLFLAAACMGVYLGAEILVGYMVLIGAMLSNSTMSYDEYDNCYPFLFSLPVSRKGYVYEKYLLTLICSVLTWVIAIVVLLAENMLNLQKAGLQRQDLSEFILISSGYILIGILINDISTPFLLKYGQERGRLAMLLSVGFFTALAYMIARKLQPEYIGADLVVAQLQTISGIGLAVILILLVLAVTLISMSISVKIMEKKE